MWLLGWTGAVAIALLNGTLRVLVTQLILGEETARQVATVTLLLLLTGYVWWLHDRYPICTGAQAWGIGLTWVAITLTFEFGFGGLLEEVVTSGRIWLLVPIWTGLVPMVPWATSYRRADHGAVSPVQRATEKHIRLRFLRPRSPAPPWVQAAMDS